MRGMTALSRQAAIARAIVKVWQGPGLDDLRRTTRVVMHDLEDILDPNTISLPMPETVF
jgi:hypothetical protein